MSKTLVNTWQKNNWQVWNLAEGCYCRVLMADSEASGMPLLENYLKQQQGVSQKFLEDLMGKLDNLCVMTLPNISDVLVRFLHYVQKKETFGMCGPPYIPPTKPVHPPSPTTLQTATVPSIQELHGTSIFANNYKFGTTLTTTSSF
jgi:hypothetical protein